MGVIQETIRLIIALKDKRTRLAAEKDKLLAIMGALRKGDKEAIKGIEFEWQARQLGRSFATSASGDTMISGYEDIPVVDEGIGG